MTDDLMSSQNEDTASIVNEPQPAIRWGWLRALLFLVALVPLAFIWGALTALIFYLAGEDLQGGAGSLSDPLGIVTQGMVVLTATLCIWLLRRFIDRRSFVSLGFSLEAPFTRHLLEGLLWGLGLMGVIFGLTLAMGGIHISSVQFPAQSLAVMAAVIIMAAFLEEIMLRGYLLNNLMQSTDRYVALLFISVLFAFLHSFNDNISYMGLINIVLAGLLLGVYYIHRQNLWLPITLHIAWNYLQGPILGSPVSGEATPSVLTLEFSGSDLITGGKFGFEASLVTTVVLTLATVAIHLVYRNKPSRVAA